ncbi:MAG: phosphate signaling complex protein PhoU [Oscillospiraceae bacterium]
MSNSIRSVFDYELNILNEDLIEMSSLVESAIKDSMSALFKSDSELARKIVEQDDKVNKLEQIIEKRCLRLLISQQPVAHDFRAVTAALKMITDLERIGDHASDISKISLHFDDFSKVLGVEEEIPKMAEIAALMVHDSIKAYINKDLELSKKIILLDEEADKLFNNIKKSVVLAIKEDEKLIDSVIDLVMIAKYLERISEHAVNICEWVEFYVTGKHKHNKIF